jgi:2-amino-4-hydroxy-6-hydroxymethyldihydropteridine diphosphokinase
MSTVVYLSLGSNLCDREKNLRDAISRLGSEGRVISVSSFYETEPVDFVAQPWFLNCAMALETELLPESLMAAVLRIEREMGRLRTQDKGPRTIDIDILLYGDLIVNSEHLTIPHPAMHQRRFVLEPLAEIAAEAKHPLLKQSLAELRDALVGDQAVRKLKQWNG